MTETEKKHRIRWLLLVPGVLGASALALACGLGAVALLTWITDDFVILGLILPATTAAVWVGTAYYIAPSRQIAVMWWAYLAGNLFLLIVLPLPPIWLAAAIGGLIACGYYIDKNRKSTALET